MFKKTIVASAIVGVLSASPAFALVDMTALAANNCDDDSYTDLVAGAQKGLADAKARLAALNDAKKSIKPQTGLSCLDNLGLAASMGFPSWSRILSSITNQVKNKACTQITQGISSVSGAINQSIGFKGIPGVDGQIIDGSGISMNGGVNQSGTTGIYTNGSLSTPGYTTSPTPFQKIAPVAAPQQANESGLMDRLSRAIKSAF